MKRFFYGILGIWAIYACACLAAPEPAIVPAPGQWTLNMEFTHPQQITLLRGSDNKKVNFWYTIITLTNNTGNDVDFYPKCDLMTDSFQIIPAGKFVSSMLFDQISRNLQDLNFCIIAVADDSAIKKSRASRYICQAIRNHTTSAGFRDSKSFMTFDQKLSNGFL